MVDKDWTAPEGWLTIPEAAAHYEVSEKTVRRRVAAGSYEAKKVKTHTGQVWIVRTEDKGQDIDLAMELAMELATVKKELAKLKETVGNDRDKALMAVIRQLQEERGAAAKKPTWWQRLKARFTS